jgi:hypothetical protein
MQTTTLAATTKVWFQPDRAFDSGTEELKTAATRNRQRQQVAGSDDLCAGNESGCVGEAHLVVERSRIRVALGNEKRCQLHAADRRRPARLFYESCSNPFTAA